MISLPKILTTKGATINGETVYQGKNMLLFNVTIV